MYLCVDISQQQLSLISPEKTTLTGPLCGAPVLSRRPRQKSEAKLMWEGGQEGRPLPHSEFSHVAGEGMNIGW